jgi:hypothetical protein
MLEALPESKPPIHIQAIEGDCDEHEQVDRSGQGVGGNQGPYRRNGESFGAHQGSAGLILDLRRHSARSAKTGTVPLSAFNLGPNQ